MRGCRAGRLRAGLVAVACLCVSGCGPSTTNDVMGKEEGKAAEFKSQADYFKHQQANQAKTKVKRSATRR